MDINKLDELVSEYKKQRNDYEQKSKLAKDSHKDLKDIEWKLLNILEENGKTKYFVDGIGTVMKVERRSVQTPKTKDEKKAFLKYLQKRGGEELVYAYMSINSQALNKFYNETVEEYGPMHEVPGIGMPISTAQLRFKGA